MTATLDSTPAPSLDAHVLKSGGGAGVYFAAKAPDGISLQLGALGIVLGLLSAGFANVYDSTAIGVIVPVALSVGAVAIFAGGIINFRAGIMVAGVIGCLYGTFWLSLGILLQVSAVPLQTAVGVPTFGDAFGTYLLLWGIMSALLCLPVAFVSKVVLAQQALLAVVFVVLALAYFALPGGTTTLKTGGWLGLVDAIFCLYISAAIVTNETAGKVVLPLP